MSSTGSSPLTLESGLSGSISSFLGKSNEKFFKLIGLEGITNVARRYAYNVGVIDAHKTIRKIVTTLDKKGINNIYKSCLGQSPIVPAALRVPPALS